MKLVFDLGPDDKVVGVNAGGFIVHMISLQTCGSCHSFVEVSVHAST